MNAPASLNRTNMYANNCDVCGVRVPPNRGFVVPRDVMRHAVTHSRKWCTICTDRKCAAAVVGEQAVEETNARELRADGTIVMPYDEKALPLLRAISEWDPEAKCWRASLLLRDRDLVLRIADALALDVAPELRTYEDPEPVRAAVERARAVPTIRDYQIEGVRWLAYRGTATGVAEGYKDKRPGALLADDMGCGKSAQTLLALHDDEALLVVCPSNAKAVWPREAARWRPGRFDTVTICDGADSFRWPESPRELVVINYDVLPWTPAQIEDERAKHMLARHGRKADPRVTDSAERKAVVGLLTQLHRVADDYSEAVEAGDEHTTAGRHRLFTLLTEWLDVAVKCERNNKALRDNAERKPAGNPPCKVLLVGDEAHYVENNKALRTVRWRALADKCTRVIGLTGTPVESEPMKLYGLLTSLRCNPFSWSSFLKQFNGYPAQWGGYEFARVAPEIGSTARGAVKVEPGTTEILSRALLRRTKTQVLSELPPKIYSEIPVSLSPKLIKELDEIAAQHIDIILRGELPEFGDMAVVRKALAAASIDAMLEIVESHEAAGIPLVVFSAHLGPIEALAKRKGWFTITGETSAKKRGEIQDAFQAGEGFGVAGTRAMAEAMTLTRASTVLFVDRFWERKYNVQAEDRCHRIGQHDSVNVVTLVPDHPLTQHVADLLSSKYAFVDAVLHGEQSYDAPPPSRFTDESEDEWRARVAAKAEHDRARQEDEDRRCREQRERELAKIAEREVSPKVSEQRAKLRAERLGIKVDPRNSVPADVVRDATAYMLSVCDGAATKDNEGFNKPDGAVMRWLAPGVMAGSEYAVASAAVILRHYPRQLAVDFPALFMNDTPSTATTAA